MGPKVDDEKIIDLDDDKPVNQKKFWQMQKALADLQEKTSFKSCGGDLRKKRPTGLQHYA